MRWGRLGEASLRGNMENVIRAIKKKFENEPYAYFTENDLVCELVELIKKLTPSLGVKDVKGEKHSRLHTEYATPFRCCMKGSKFELKGEMETDGHGRKYRRGHYDIVLLSDDFVSSNELSVVQGQQYNPGNVKKGMIDLGIEVMFLRNPIKPSRGGDTERGLNNVVGKILQDWKKLAKSNELGYMTDYIMLVFIRESDNLVKGLLERKLKGYKGLNLIGAWPR